MNSRKYETFEDWFYETEGYGFRSERAFDQSIEYVEDALLNPHKDFMIKWLKAAFEAGKEENERY